MMLRERALSMLCSFCYRQLQPADAVLRVTAGVVRDDGQFENALELVYYLHVECPTLEDSTTEGGASCRQTASEQ